MTEIPPDIPIYDKVVEDDDDDGISQLPSRGTAAPADLHDIRSSTPPVPRGSNSPRITSPSSTEAAASCSCSRPTLGYQDEDEEDDRRILREMAAAEASSDSDSTIDDDDDNVIDRRQRKQLSSSSASQNDGAGGIGRALGSSAASAIFGRLTAGLQGAAALPMKRSPRVGASPRRSYGGDAGKVKGTGADDDGSGASTPRTPSPDSFVWRPVMPGYRYTGLRFL